VAAVAPFARALPWIELGAAALLFVGANVAAAAAVVAGLCALFVAATTVALMRRVDLDCSCFGLLYHERIGRRTVARDSLLCAVAAAVFTFDEGRFGWVSVLDGHSGP